ncbi:ferric reductase like transmembrane component-domain-containing protein [Dactylonectria estremocensis]|uniref:ferric-chelate reductase (NADPH) n=1 Tax=Dactylonectria estremocensis TaxID=1079267 RepID=A0A9P9E620_9HYPO|nr:ferric reductase like transmembrane component-domain-containing protein [Dactylonectria estremocensis]
MGSGAGTQDPEEAALQEKYHTWGEADNTALSNYLFIICGAVSVAVIFWRLADKINKTVRKVACLNNDRQRYFALPSSTLASVKRHILYAPVFRKRHNREIQLSSAVNMGTLPTRFQLLFLSAYFATNVVFCVIEIPFAQSNAIAAASLRNRSGVLSVLNMIPLFLLAGRNNPLIPLLGISFDTYNLIHRWFGRIVILEALVHTLAHYQKNNWAAAAFESTFSVPFLLWGFVATCSFVALGLQAFSPVRHAYYEIFKTIHIALAILAVYGLWIHLAQYPPQFTWLKAAAGLWAADRAARVLRMLWSHLGGSRSRTIVEALPGNAVRLTTTLARPWSARPGQHAYLYMPSLSLWQSHPFSIAWVDGVEDASTERLASTRQDLMAPQQMRVSYVIRARTGFTDSLYKKALAAPGGRLETTCYSEGPYGGTHSLESYGTAVLFAGGVGITHQVPYVQKLVAGYSEGTVATRKILLVWTIQSPEHLEWIRPWMTEILAMDKRRDVLRIMLFVSQPRSTKEIHSPSSTVQMFPGRPNIDTLLSMEQEHQVGTMVVSVCGPGALGDEVRRAVRARQDRSSIDFIEEAFTW